MAPSAVVGAMLRFEAALARAQAELGLIPACHADRIALVCTPHEGPSWDVDALMARSRTAGSLAIPVVQELTARVRALDPGSAASVHWGATSQDAIDTAFVLQAREAQTVLEAALERVLAALQQLLEQHGHRALLARTLMQPATVIPLATRLSHWREPLQRSLVSLRTLAPQALRLQLGGPVGTRSAWGPSAESLAQAVARQLGLPEQVQPWQVQRDALGRWGCELGVATAALAKVANDVALMAQAEVAELWEAGAPGRGGSSAMPHKRNPVGCLVARAAQTRTPGLVAALLTALPQEQERALGAWQAELAVLAELLGLSTASAVAMAEALEGAQVDGAAMQRNIDALLGLPMAEALSRRWAAEMGRDGAHAAVERLCRLSVQTRRPLLELALEAHPPADAHSAAELRALFDPDQAVASARAASPDHFSSLL